MLDFVFAPHAEFDRLHRKDANQGDETDGRADEHEHEGSQTPDGRVIVVGHAIIGLEGEDIADILGDVNEPVSFDERTAAMVGNGDADLVVESCEDLGDSIVGSRRRGDIEATRTAVEEGDDFGRPMILMLSGMNGHLQRSLIWRLFDLVDPKQVGEGQAIDLLDAGGQHAANQRNAEGVEHRLQDARGAVCRRVVDVDDVARGRLGDARDQYRAPAEEAGRVEAALGRVVGVERNGAEQILLAGEDQGDEGAISIRLAGIAL